MPFTFSHVAAAVPLRRYGLVISALIVGSMAPDFEYFVRLTGQGRSAHSYPGVLFYTLPVALIALLVFHELLKRPVLSVLPDGLRSRLVEPARQFRWLPANRFGLILLSLTVGVATHLAWDSFTHDEGWVCQTWPAMRVTLLRLGGSKIAAFKIAQHGSTLLGAALVVFWAVRWYRHAPKCDKELSPSLSPTARVVIISLGATIAVAAGFAKANRAGELVTLSALQKFVAGFVVTGITIAVLELILFSAVWWIYLAWRTSAARL